MVILLNLAILLNLMFLRLAQDLALDLPFMHLVSSDKKFLTHYLLLFKTPLMCQSSRNSLRHLFTKNDIELNFDPSCSAQWVNLNCSIDYIFMNFLMNMKHFDM